MTVKSRVYVVDAPDGIATLVRAGSKNAAINFKARGLFTATVATQQDLIDALQSGAKIEDATEDAQSTEPEPAAGAAAAATPAVKPPPPVQTPKPAAAKPPAATKPAPGAPPAQKDGFLEGIMNRDAPPASAAAVRRQPPPPPPPATVDRMDLSDEGDEGEIL